MAHPGQQSVVAARVIWEGKMNTPRVFFVCGATLLLATVAGCAPPQSSDSIAIVQAAYERLNAGDVDGFLAFCADDAVLADEEGRAVGHQAIRKYWEEELSQGYRFELSDFSVNGNVVTYTSKIFIGDIELPATNQALDVIKGGRIIFDGSANMYRLECEYDASQAFCPGN